VKERVRGIVGQNEKRSSSVRSKRRSRGRLATNLMEEISINLSSQ
jgi:hypothetical protein